MNSMNFRINLSAVNKKPKFRIYIEKKDKNYDTFPC